MQPEKSGILKLFFTAAGLLFLAFGALGVFIRGLPTTPMLLLAAACFCRGNEKIHNWMYSHPGLGPVLRDFRDKKGVSLKLKIYSLVSAWAVIGSIALFAASSIYLRMFLLSLAVIKTFLMLRVIPTKPGPLKEDRAVDLEQL